MLRQCEEPRWQESISKVQFMGIYNEWNRKLLKLIATGPKAIMYALYLWCWIGLETAPQDGWLGSELS
jgi:hypothetical protein